MPAPSAEKLFWLMLGPFWRKLDIFCMMKRICFVHNEKFISGCLEALTWGKLCVFGTKLVYMDIGEKSLCVFVTKLVDSQIKSE